MDWAIDAAGDHVRAGTPAACRHSLRCPVCRSSVYHRHGAYNRPHFAHYSRNFNQACELYHPGAGGASLAGLTPTALPSFGAPALLWRDSASIPLSLQLRLPKVPKGYASTLAICSSLGKTHFSGDDLVRTSFVQLPLQAPPAKVESYPTDLGMMMRIEALLGQFRLSGNYFRATASGGVLESVDAALELGEDYILLTQRPLSESQPQALEHRSPPRQHRSWIIYQLHLRDDFRTRTGDVAALQSCLGRAITVPKPRVDIVWPPPHRFDTDGVPLFADNTTELVAKTGARALNVVAERDIPTSVENLGEGLYRIKVGATSGEVAIWPPLGSTQHARFESQTLTAPDGVALISSNGRIGLMSQAASDEAARSGHAAIAVPSELLWRNARCDGHRVTPVPNGLLHTFERPFNDLDFGSFGSISIPASRPALEVRLPSWHARLEGLVIASCGLVALTKLKTVRSKHEALSWAVENNATHILPLILSAFSAEAARGIS